MAAWAGSKRVLLVGGLLYTAFISNATHGALLWLWGSTCSEVYFLEISVALILDRWTQPRMHLNVPHAIVQDKGVRVPFTPRHNVQRTPGFEIKPAKILLPLW